MHFPLTGFGCIWLVLRRGYVRTGQLPTGAAVLYRELCVWPVDRNGVYGILYAESSHVGRVDVLVDLGVYHGLRRYVVLRTPYTITVTYFIRLLWLLHVWLFNLTDQLSFKMTFTVFRPDSSA